VPHHLSLTIYLSNHFVLTPQPYPIPANANLVGPALCLLRTNAYQSSSFWQPRPIFNMSVPNYNHTEESRLEYGDTDQFTCPRCYKIISASRPPIFNSDNCSCVEAAAFSNGILMQRTQPSPYEQTPWLHYEASPPMYQQYHPESYASSNRSVPSPEGVENAQPNMNISSNFLPLAPETGLNEAQHRRTSSIHTDMSYQMRRFLVERDYNQPISAPTPAPSPFLSQETHILSQTPPRRERGSRRSKQSKKSLQSSEGGDLGYLGFGAEASTAVGAWATEGNDGFLENQYAMTLSGVSDFVIGE
jgi:hypothetical protein